MAEGETPGIDENFIRRGAEKITDADIHKMAEREPEIRARLEEPGPLERFFHDGILLLSLIKDYCTGRYRRVPYWAVAAVVFTFMYVINPIDVIPDTIPVLGLVEDAVMVGLCLTLIAQELHEYKKWKADQDQ